MKISTKLRYAARMLVLLSEKNKIMNTNDIAKEIDVSPMYLRVLANDLEKKGLIKSIRGAKGGYKLLKNPNKISIKDIADIHETLELVPCLEEPKVCPFSSICKMRKFWLGLRDTLLEYLEKWSVEDIAKL
jgi:Rrf2 family protein